MMRADREINVVVTAILHIYTERLETHNFAISLSSISAYCVAVDVLLMSFFAQVGGALFVRVRFSKHSIFIYSLKKK